MTKVKQILHRREGVLSLSADTSLEEALATLKQAGAEALPVVADGKVIGGITRAQLQRTLDFERDLGVNLENLNYEVSPNDCMFDGRTHVYLGAGYTVIRCIRRGLSGRSPASILDFGCGHGRILRFLKLVFPDADIAASDIDPDAVRFCQERLGVRTFLSAEDPRDISEPGGPFDLIWVGSVFTHIDAHRWPLLLRFLESVLSDAGILIFTIQGPTAAQRLRDGIVDWGLGPELTQELLENFSDFSYVDYPHSRNYGISLSTIEWVRGQVESQTSLRIANYNEQGMDKHQDFVTCRKAG